MKLNQLFRDILGVLSSNVVSVIMGLFAGIVIARYLGPEGRGVFGVLITVPTIVLSFGALGMQRATLFHLANEKFNNNQVLGSLLFLWLTASTLGVLAVLTSFYFIDSSFLKIDLIIALATIIPFQLGISYMGGVYLGFEKYKGANMFRWSRPVVNLVLLCIFLIILQMDVRGAVYAYAISVALIFFYGLNHLITNFGFKPKINTSVMKSMLTLGIQYALSFFMIQLNLRIDILILNDLLSKSEVGYYSVASNVAEQLWQLPMAIGVVVMTKTAVVSQREQMDRKIGTILRLSTLTGIVGASALALISPYIIPLVFGKAFASSALITNFLLPGIVFFMIFRVLNSRLDGIGKPLVAVYIAVPALLLNIVLNYLLIPLWGTIGAALASDISYFCAALAMMIVYSKINNHSLKELILIKSDDFSWITKRKRTDHNETNQPSPFFILARPRSGTYMLQSILNNHKEIVIPPECPLILNFYSKYGKLKTLSTKKQKELIADLKQYREFRNWNIDWDILKEQLHSLETFSYQKFIQMFYLHQAKKNHEQVKIFGDKNPVYTLEPERLLKIYPNAKFIHLVRDYRDQLVSIKKIDFEMGHPGVVAQRWKDSIRKMERLAKIIPENVFTLRYEDLVSNPEFHLRELCTFLGVDYDLKMLEAFNKKTETGLDKNESERYHKSLTQPLNTSSIGVFKRHLSKNDIAMTEYIAGNVGEKYAYPRSNVSLPKRLLPSLFLAKIHVSLMMRLQIIIQRLPFRLRLKLVYALQDAVAIIRKTIS